MPVPTVPQATPQAMAPTPPPRLLDQVRLTARQRGHVEPTVTAFADWCLRFIRFHGKRHPGEMGVPEIGQFLESVAQTEKDPVPALAASRDALGRQWGGSDTLRSYRVRKHLRIKGRPVTGTFSEAVYRAVYSPGQFARRSSAPGGRRKVS
jgi:hypothetical protein